MDDDERADRVVEVERAVADFASLLLFSCQELKELGVGGGVPLWDAVVAMEKAARAVGLFPPPDQRQSTRPNAAEKRRMRKVVLPRDGFTCQLCRWRPTQVPEPYDGEHVSDVVPWNDELFGHGRAPYAGMKTTRSLMLDHVVPYSLGGRWGATNLRALCCCCNLRRGPRLLDMLGAGGA